MGEIQRYRDNLQDEIDGAALYAALAESEADPTRKDLFLQLAQAENEHADVWRGKLLAAGVRDFPERPGLKTRFMIRLARYFGPTFVLPVVAANEYSDRNKYAGQPDALALSAEEQGHAAVIRAAAGHAGMAADGSDIVRAESWHRGASGNELRAAVLGVNDGLVSNFCLVMGVAGAGSASPTVLLTGLAGLVAGALSMALGEWLSVTNARELARTQIDKEAEELEQTPEAEKKELALIYQAKGIARDQAVQIAAKVMENRETALDTLVREELGIDPAELGGNPWSAAGVSLLLFALGAIFPVAPFMWLENSTAIAASVALSLLGLGAVGMVTALFNGRSFSYSALRQVLFGGVAAAITFGVGIMFGASIA
ncbi:VIT1/CCC1 transporter family protein [Propionivibrio limicola]|uniref:VIT1/CCC1 transporter family protein n=1 Tax=Propionivibrio limicola TaxID=167645 RepID=UPI0012918907|nr:VIT1/CCC1 transporter family protein [Propionivibrio limicola]